MTSIIFPTSFRGKSKFVIFVREDIFCYRSEIKWVTTLMALSLAFVLSNALRGAKMEGNFSIVCQCAQN